MELRKFAWKFELTYKTSFLICSPTCFGVCSHTEVSWWAALVGREEVLDRREPILDTRTRHEKKMFSGIKKQKQNSSFYGFKTLRTCWNDWVRLLNDFDVRMLLYCREMLLVLAWILNLEFHRNIYALGICMERQNFSRWGYLFGKLIRFDWS